MPTRAELIQDAKRLGLCCFWSLKKAELEVLVAAASRKSPIPSKYKNDSPPQQPKAPEQSRQPRQPRQSRQSRQCLTKMCDYIK